MTNRHGLSLVVLACLITGLATSPLAAGTKGLSPGCGKQTSGEPRLIQKVAPKYPEDAKTEGVAGVVILEAVIATDGSVRETRVRQTADPRLTDAARAAVGLWRYEPERDEQGVPVEALVTVTIRFALADK